jgi:hypothetical protein
MRKARQSIIEIGGVKLTITRPTDLDALEMQYSSTRAAIEGISKFVIDWKGVNEIDLVPGGTSEPVPFDPEIFSEWIKDKPELWESLITEVRNSYQAYRKNLETETKN